jgi:hypothetical protein
VYQHYIFLGIFRQNDRVLDEIDGKNPGGHIIIQQRYPDVSPKKIGLHYAAFAQVSVSVKRTVTFNRNIFSVE